MNKEKAKALVFTALLFGSLTWWVLGMPGLNYIPNIAEKIVSFKTENKNSKTNSNRKSTGTIIDSYKGVDVFYNGSISHVNGRNTTKDGYNLGLKYQCVEFAKRFYYEVFNHKMPNSYGHAKDFYNSKLKHGSVNKERNMFQYKNGGREKPRPNDLIVIGPSEYNKYGHLMIVTNVNKDIISIIQQNPGPNNPSRGKLKIEYDKGSWSIQSQNILGWLRLR